MVIFVGDCHGDFRELLDIISMYPAKDISGIFFLGDQTPERPLELELKTLGTSLLDRTWFILGNHDSDNSEYLRNHFGMWDHHLHGRVVEVEGMRIGGISGVFRQQIWYPPEQLLWRDRKSFRDHVLVRKEGLFENNLPLKHWTTIFPEDMDADEYPHPMDILLTHEAPSSHPHGFSVLDDFAKGVGAKLVVHGHHHEDSMGALGSGIQVLGVGLCQCMIWDKSMLHYG